MHEIFFIEILLKPCKKIVNIHKNVNKSQDMAVKKLPNSGRGTGVD